MRLRKLQLNLKQILLRVEYPRIGSVLGLQEAMGTLSKKIKEVEIYGSTTNYDNLDTMCADVFFAILDVCNGYNINLENASEKKLKFIKSKIQKWEKDHGKELRIKREKFN